MTDARPVKYVRGASVRLGVRFVAHEYEWGERSWFFFSPNPANYQGALPLFAYGRANDGAGRSSRRRLCVFSIGIVSVFVLRFLSATTIASGRINRRVSSLFVFQLASKTTGADGPTAVGPTAARRSNSPLGCLPRLIRLPCDDFTFVLADSTIAGRPMAKSKRNLARCLPYNPRTVHVRLKTLHRLGRWVSRGSRRCRPRTISSLGRRRFFLEREGGGLFIISLKQRIH